MDGYHESGLSPEAQDIHRAIQSLVEELLAVDAYNQRADVSTEQPLIATLLHNRDEEIEHSAVLLEWLRRRIPTRSPPWALPLIRVCLPGPVPHGNATTGWWRILRPETPC